MNITLLLFLVLIVAPISNFLHEIGHVIGAKLAGAEKIFLSIGRGKSISKLVFQTLEVRIGLLFFTSGLTESQRKKPYTSFEMVYITCFGPLVNAVAVFITYNVYQVIDNEFILVFMLYNSWLFLMNSLPFKIKDQESDGYIILKELIPKRFK